MEKIFVACLKAVQLIISFDPELMRIIRISLFVSLTAVILSGISGIASAYVLSRYRFPLRNVIINVLNALMGLPPVVVGLFLYILLSRSGPLGFLGLLYSPSAMVIAQIILAFPIVAAMSHAAIIAVPSNIRMAALGIGASEARASLVVIKDARYGIIASAMAGLGRVMAEVGAVLIVGGNIAGYTRVMTTTIALEYDKGNFELAIALGIVLLTLALALNVVLSLLQRKVRS
jgi:tungstate transport system permease protein